ncbi:hypothetical protein Syun_023954 [Stephania yunnanensis]|uniref:Uncharacterized protein n=1 Tax=Stephania yunnanensis TaxID=152371 RepID=A0AAP0FIN7_9MAGN
MEINSMNAFIYIIALICSNTTQLQLGFLNEFIFLLVKTSDLNLFYLFLL